MDYTWLERELSGITETLAAPGILERYRHLRANIA
jgi:hypothetical protein